MVCPQAIGERAVAIGSVAIGVVDELIARHLLHGPQDRLVADARDASA